MASQEIEISRKTRQPVVCSDVDENGRFWELVLPGLDSPSLVTSDPSILIYWLREAANLLASSAYPEGSEFIGEPGIICSGPFGACKNPVHTWIMLTSYVGEHNLVKRVTATPICAECLNTYLLKKSVTIPDFPPITSN